jgi:hypothetical protein
VLFVARAALAQQAPAPPAESAPPPAAPALDLSAAPPTESPPGPDEDADASATDDLIRQNEALAARQRQLVTFGGYVDFGFFAPEGNGSGYYLATNQEVLRSFPRYAGYSWVFPGDILAPAVNTRGEVADLGTAAGVDRYDGIHSGGAPSFIVDEINLRMRATPIPTAIITTSVNFTPRTGSNFSLGDMVDVDLAQIEWLPTESQRTSIFVGKIDSVLGIEYRERKSDTRFGVTPSLIARYTTGPALGLKVRSKFGDDDLLTVAVALTNGSNTAEQFFFYDETDRNAGKTVSGRLAIHPPLPFFLELGGSGSYGAQDRVTNTEHPMWFVGPDLTARIARVDLQAQWLKGGAAGDPAQNAYSLALHGGGYVEMHGMLTSWLGLLGRLGYRSADITLPPQRAYVSRNWRGTVGARFVFATWAVLKAEYLHNAEYDGVRTIPDDVFTTSLVLSY